MKRYFFSRKGLLDLCSIAVGDLILAFSIVVLLEPNQLVTGGVTGMAIIVADYSGRLGLEVPLWVTNLALNVPLFLTGLKMMDKVFLVKTAFAAAFLSLALYLASFAAPLTDDVLLASLFGGAGSGLGLGLVFRVMATTGGTDLAAGILHRHALRHHSITRIQFVIDTAIIVLGLVVFGPRAAMYAVVAVFAQTKTADALLEGLNFAKAVFIISDSAETIAAAIMERIGRGVTGLAGRGMFTGSDKCVLFCVVSAKELVNLKTVAHEHDTQAFVIVADVREVLGEGFSELAPPHIVQNR